MSEHDIKPKTPRKPKVYTVKTIDTRTHGFNVGIAIDYCPEMAIWLGHLAFWTEKNLAHDKHILNGRVWCYDTLEDMSEYFPYFSKRQLETVINNSIKEGLVSRGNYNQTGYDRTCWYALNPKAYFYFQYLLTNKNKKRISDSISQICEMEITDLWNGFHRSVTPIPDTDPYTDPNTCVGVADAPAAHTNLKKLKQQKAEQNAIECEEAQELFKAKFEGRVITLKEIFENCKEHYDQKSLWATKDKFIQWLKREKPENYPQIDTHAAKKHSLPEYHLEYSSYLSQFRNDRDILKLIASDSVALTYEDWVCQQETNASESLVKSG